MGFISVREVVPLFNKDDAIVRLHRPIKSTTLEVDCMIASPSIKTKVSSIKFHSLATNIFKQNEKKE